MIVIVLGFASASVREEPQALYVGTDAKAATAILLDPPAGIARTEIFKNPRPDRRRNFDVPKGTEEGAPVETETAAEEVPEVAEEVPEVAEEVPENIVEMSEEVDVPMPAGDAEAEPEKSGKGRKK